MPDICPGYDCPSHRRRKSIFSYSFPSLYDVGGHLGPHLLINVPDSVGEEFISGTNHSSGVLGRAPPGLFAFLADARGSTVAFSIVTFVLVKKSGQPHEPRGEIRKRPR